MARPGRTIRLPRPAIKFNQFTVKAEPSVKYLGIMLDKEFRFNEHAAYALGKGTKWANQVKRLANTSAGVSSSSMRLLYKAVVVPKMLYAADIFCANKIGRAHV